MSKFLIRSVIAFVAVMALGAIGIGVAGVMAFQQPAFYADLRDHTPSQDEQALVQADMEELMQSLEVWSRLSLARQTAAHRVQGDKKGDFPVALLMGDQAVMGGEAYDPAADVRIVTVTQDQLNAALASEKQGDLKLPRIQIRKDCFRVGCELDSGNVSCVLTVDFRMTATEDGDVRLDIVGGQVGKLPIPLKTFLKYLPDDLSGKDDDIEVNLSGKHPHLLVRLGQKDRPYPTIRSVETTDGEITFAIAAPVLPERSATCFRKSPVANR